MEAGQHGNDGKCKLEIGNYAHYPNHELRFSHIEQSMTEILAIIPARRLKRNPAQKHSQLRRLSVDCVEHRGWQTIEGGDARRCLNRR